MFVSIRRTPERQWTLCCCTSDTLLCFVTVHFNVMFPVHSLLKFYTGHHTISNSSLSVHSVPQSTYRHTLFPSERIATPYSPVNLSPHPISQSAYRHTLFPSQPIGTPYSPVNLSAHLISETSSRHSLLASRAEWQWTNKQTNKNRDRGDVTFKFSVASYRSPVHHHQQSTPFIWHTAVSSWVLQSGALAVSTV
jgi:hypothetical protein